MMTEEKKRQIAEAMRRGKEQKKASSDGTPSKHFVRKGLVYDRVDIELPKYFYIYQVNEKWYEAWYTKSDKAPTDEAFGRSAYSCTDLEDAKRCIRVLMKKFA